MAQVWSAGIASNQRHRRGADKLTHTDATLVRRRLSSGVVHVPIIYLPMSHTVDVSWVKGKHSTMVQLNESMAMNGHPMHQDAIVRPPPHPPHHGTMIPSALERTRPSLCWNSSYADRRCCHDLAFRCQCRPQAINDPNPDSTIPTSQFFSEGNGGESRKSYHGYPQGNGGTMTST